MTDQHTPDAAPEPEHDRPATVLPSPGEWLKQTREQAGLTVEQVAKDLYLDTQVIRAIEIDRYAEVGAPVYARGYLRRYAKLLGLAETGVLSRYDTLQGTPRVVDPIPAAHGSIPPPRRLLPRWLSWVLLLAVLATLVVFVVQSRDEATAPQPKMTTLSVAAPVVVTTASSAASIAAAPSASPATTPLQAAAATSVASVQLQLSFTGESWVEVYDAEQKAVMYEMAPAGASRDLSGTPPLKVTLGSAQNVQLRVNGQLLSVPAERVQANVAHFEINAAGQIQ